MYDDDDDDTILANIKYKVHVTRVVGNNLIPTIWKIKSDIVMFSPEEIAENEIEDEEDEDEVIDPIEPPIPEPVSETKSEDEEDDFDDGMDEDEEDDYDHDIDHYKLSLMKVKFWFDNIVDGCIVFSRDNKWAMKTFIDKKGKIRVNNRLMILPEEPSDSLMIQIFHSKMNAITGKYMSFGITEIESNTGDDEIGYTFFGDGELELPTMEEWMGPRNWFSKPWWARDDTSTFDLVCPDDADLSEPPKFAVKMDFLMDIANPIVVDDSNIIRPDFKPHIIKGADDQA